MKHPDDGPGLPPIQCAAILPRVREIGDQRQEGSIDPLLQRHIDDAGRPSDGGLHPLAQPEFKSDHTREEIDRRFFAIATDLAGVPSDLIAPDGTFAWLPARMLGGSGDTLDSKRSVPKYIQLEAQGNKGFSLDRLLDNPAHEQRQRHRRGLL